MLLDKNGMFSLRTMTPASTVNPKFAKFEGTRTGCLQVHVLRHVGGGMKRYLYFMPTKNCIKIELASVQFAAI